MRYATKVALMSNEQWAEEWKRVTAELKKKTTVKKPRGEYKAKFHRTTSHSGFWW